MLRSWIPTSIASPQNTSLRAGGHAVLQAHLNRPSRSYERYAALATVHVSNSASARQRVLFKCQRQDHDPRLCATLQGRIRTLTRTRPQIQLDCFFNAIQPPEQESVNDKPNPPSKEEMEEALALNSFVLIWIRDPTFYWETNTTYTHRARLNNFQQPQLFWTTWMTWMNVLMTNLRMRSFKPASQKRQCVWRIVNGMSRENDDSAVGGCKFYHKPDQIWLQNTATHRPQVLLSNADEFFCEGRG